MGGSARLDMSHCGSGSNHGIAALTASESSQDVGYSRLGLRAATKMVIGGMQLVPHASAAWLHAFGDETPDMALAFAGPGVGFAIAGVPIARDSALLDAGSRCRHRFGHDTWCLLPRASRRRRRGPRPQRPPELEILKEVEQNLRHASQMSASE